MHIQDKISNIDYSKPTTIIIIIIMAETSYSRAARYAKIGIFSSWALLHVSTVR